MHNTHTPPQSACPVTSADDMSVSFHERQTERERETHFPPLLCLSRGAGGADHNPTSLSIPHPHEEGWPATVSNEEHYLDPTHHSKAIRMAMRRDVHKYVQTKYFSWSQAYI